MRKSINKQSRGWRVAILNSAALAMVGGAMAQDGFSLWETEIDAEAVIALAAETDGDSPLGHEEILYAVTAEFEAERVFENGNLAGVKLSGGLQMDHPGRPGFSGRVPQSFGPGVLPALPPPPRSTAYPGFSTFAPVLDDGPHGQLEQAYVFLKGGYGEVRIGRDRGVAARFSETPPSVFSHATIDSARLDNSGLASVRADHDMTGPAEKISFTSPRIIGLRAGLSYTPDASVRGLDRALLPEASIDQHIEGALNLSRRLPESKTRIEVNLAYGQGDVEAFQPNGRSSGDLKSWSASSRVEFESVTIGARYLEAQQDVSGFDDHYAAWSIGAQKSFGEYEASLEWGEASDDSIDSDGDSWAIGVSRSINENIGLAVGYQQNGIAFQNNDWDSGGIVVEITLSR